MGKCHVCNKSKEDLVKCEGCNQNACEECCVSLTPENMIDFPFCNICNDA